MRPNLEEGLRAVQRLGVREVGIRLERAHLVRHERVDAREHLLERREELFALGCQFLVCLALLDVVDLPLQLLVVDVVCLPAGVLHVEHTHAELHHGGGMICGYVVGPPAPRQVRTAREGENRGRGRLRE